MTEKGNLGARVSALEGEVGELRERVRRTEQDAAAARVLAGGADRDVSEIRAEIRDFREQNLRLHNATREDITDIRGKLDLLRGKLDLLATGQQQIVNLITRAIDRKADGG
ncbi:hypothetical protein [Nocardia jinanensis]|uniref:Uncharacterized protein n=1 Tax=Nocardia jinanensis TaxID=382504 RepID=A0A917VWU7_9NOCA|nr:hypothetical protein [Nocardia jinanensis]GGL23546.1 hypothetical protein GCM10011588_43050 [Nocardia jinanensis]